MSQTIDDRIVSLEFDNKDFEKNVSESLATLESLKKSIVNLQEASENLKGLSEATKGFDFSTIQNGIQSIGDKLNVIKNINIVEFIASAADRIKAIFKSVDDSFVGTAFNKFFNQANTGGQSRALKMEQAQFQLEGVYKNAKMATEAVQAANRAVDGTAFGLDAAATVASQFAATGLKDMSKMEHYLRGVAGVAAMGGRSFEEIGHIFTTVSGQGRLMRTQLNQLAVSGISAGSEIANFFNAVNKGLVDNVTPEVEKAVKELTKGLNVSEASINEFISKGKISFDMFAQSMDYAFGEHAKDANNTFNGALDNMKAAISRIGQGFWEPINKNMIPVFNNARLMFNAFKGNLKEVYVLFERIVVFLRHKVVDAIKGVTKFLKEDFTGMDHIINGLYNLLYAVMKVVYAVANAFKSAFPFSLGELVNNLAEGFEKLTAKLIMSDKTAAVVSSVFKALFSVFGLVKNVLSALSNPIGKIIGFVGTLIMVISNIVSKASDFIKNLIQTIDFSKVLHTVLAALAGVFLTVRNGIIAFFNAARDGSTIFGKVSQAVGSFLKTVGGTVLKVLAGAVVTVVNLFNKLRSLDFGKIQNGIAGAFTKVKAFVASLKEMPVVTQAINNVQYAISKLALIFNTIKQKIKDFFESFTVGSRSMTREVSSNVNILQVILNGLITILKVLAAVIGGVVMAALTAFNAAFEKIRSIDFSGISTFFTNLIDKFKSINIVTKAVDAFKNSGGNIIDVFRAIVDGIKEFITKIKDGNINIDFFKDKLISLRDFLLKVKEAIKDGLFGDSITRGVGGSSGFSAFIDTLKEKFNSLKDVVVKVFTKMREEGMLSKVLMVAYAGGIINALFKIPNAIAKLSGALTSQDGLFSSVKGMFSSMTGMFDGINNSLNQPGGVFTTLGEAIKNWGKPQERSNIELFAEAFRSLAISVAILAASIGALTLVDSEKLKTAAIILGVLAGSLILISGALTILSSKNKIDDSFFRSFAINMLAMTTSIVILASAMAIIASIELNLGKVIVTILILAGIMAAMYLLTKAMSKLDLTGATLRSALYILSFALAVRIMVSSLASIMELPIENLNADFFIVLTGIVALFSIFALACSNVKISSALGVLALLLIFKMMFEYLRSLTDMNWEGLANRIDQWKNQLTVIIIAVTAMLVFLRIRLAMISAMLGKVAIQLGKNLLYVGGGLALLGAGFLLMAMAIKKLGGIQWKEVGDNIRNGLSAIGLIFASILLIVALLKSQLEGVNQAFISIAGAFALLGLACLELTFVSLLMKMINWPELLKAMSLMTMLILGMIGVIAATNGSEKISFKTILAMVIGLIALISALIILSLMCSNDQVFYNLLKADGLLLLIMGGMAAVLKGVGSIRTGTAWKPLLMAVLMFGTVLAALYLIGNQVKSTNDLVALAAIAGILISTVYLLIKVTEGFMKFAKKMDAGRGKWVTKSLAVLGGVIGAFAIIAGSLMGIKALGGGIELAGIAASIGVVIAILCQAAIGLIEGTKNVQWSRIAKSGAVLGGMVLALVAVAGSFMLLRFIDTEGLVIKVVAIAAVIAELIYLAAFLLEKTKNLQWGRIAKTGAVLGGMIVALAAVAGSLMLLNFVNSEGLIVKVLALGGVIAELIFLAGVLLESTKNLQWGRIAKTGVVLGGLIVALVAVAGSLLLLNFIDVNNGFITKVVALGLVMAELTGIAILLGKFGEQSAKSFIAIAGLAMITVIFGLLAGVFVLIGQLPSEGILAKSQIVMLALVELLAIQIILSNMGSIKGMIGAVGLGLMVGVFALLALVFRLISDLPLEGILAKSQIVMLSLLELAAIYEVMGMLGANSALGLIGIVGLAAMVVIFGLLAIVFNIVADLPLEGILAKSQIIVLTLFELAVIYEVMGMLGITSALGLLGVVGLALMVVIFGLLSVVFVLISALPLEGMLAKSQILILTLFELAAIYEIMGLLGVLSAAGIIGVVGLGLMVAVLGLLSVIFILISSLPLEGMLEKSQILMLVMLELAAIMEIMGMMAVFTAAGIAGAAGLLVMALALIPLAYALQMLSGIPFEELSGGVMAIALSLGILLAAGALAQVVGLGLITLAGAILILSAAVLVAGYGVQLFANALTQLSSMGPAQLSMLQAVIMTFFNSVSLGIMTFGQSIVMTITSIGMAIVMTINMIIMGIVMAIANGLTMIVMVITQQATAISQSVTQTLATLPTDILNAIVDGISSIGQRVFDAGKEIGNKLVKGFRKATGWNSPPAFIVNFFKDAGVAVNENAEGLSDLFEGTGNDWGSALSTALQDKVSSVDFSQIGSMISGEIADGFDISSVISQLTALTGFDFGGKERAIKALNEEAKRTNMQGGVYHERLKAINKQFDETTGSGFDFMSMLGGLTDGVDDLNGSLDGTSKSGKGASDSVKDLGESLLQTLEGQMNIFDKFEDKDPMSPETMLENMHSQINGMTKWAADMNKLAERGVDEGLLSKLAELGPQGADKVAAFVNMTDEQLKEASTLWGQSIALPQKVTDMLMYDLSITGKNMGKNLMTGEAEGITENVEEAVKEMETSQELIEAGGNKINKISSPSKLYWDMGRFIMLGLRNGIEDHRELVFEAMRVVCEGLKMIAENRLSSETFRDYGINIVDGIRQGVEDEKANERLKKSISKLAKDTSKTFTSKNDGIDSSSPSKLFARLGSYIPLGIAVGIEKKASAVTDAISGIANDGYSQLRDTLNSISKMVEDDVDDPVITPVLDLSNVTSGARKLNSLLSSNQAYAASGVMNNLQNGYAPSGTTFIQNNYSPKALSRADIYRQTKNQFSQYTNRYVTGYY